MKKILIISIIVIFACGLVSFVGIGGSNDNHNGPSIIFKKENNRQIIERAVYEDMQALNYHDKKNVVIRHQQHHKTTSAYKGKNYVTTNTNTESALPQIAVAHNAVSYGMSNGNRTGMSNGLVAQNVAYNSFSNIKMRNNGVAIASNGTTIMTGTIYGAAADHDHSIGDMDANGATCGQDGCDAHGKWVYNEATGVWGIEWETPIGDAFLPLLLFLLLYIPLRRKI